jgi:hypothetical protein
MANFYLQREAGSRDRLTALAVAVGVGGLSFYLTRMLLARESLESKAPHLVASKPSRRSLSQREGAQGC